MSEMNNKTQNGFQVKISIEHADDSVSEHEYLRSYESLKLIIEEALSKLSNFESSNKDLSQINFCSHHRFNDQIDYVRLFPLCEGSIML